MAAERSRRTPLPFYGESLASLLTCSACSRLHKTDVGQVVSERRTAISYTWSVKWLKHCVLSPCRTLTRGMRIAAPAKIRATDPHRFGLGSDGSTSGDSSPRSSGRPSAGELWSQEPLVRRAYATVAP